MFIVVEGLEGSGKTTLCLALQEYFGQTYPDREVCITRAPGSTPLGLAIRGLLLNPDITISPRSEALLFAADLYEHLTKTIEPALAENKIVISDRYYLSTIAYQAYGRSIGPAWIYKLLNPILMSQVKPDLILLLDIPVAESICRLKARGNCDRIESESLDFWERVSYGYKCELNKQVCKHSIDATQSADAVLAEAINTIETALNLLVRD